MEITVVPRRTEAERLKDYRTRKGDEYRAKDSARKRRERASAIPQFIGVDSEGIGRGPKHRAVLLGVGTESYTCKDLSKGLQWDEVFEFLYGQFERYPTRVFVGFYLGYDFNQWLSTLIAERAWLLFSAAGRAKRLMKGVKGRRKMFPVRCGDWEFDILGLKMLSLRPRVCRCIEEGIKCKHPAKPWMHVCDAGPFFQMSFVKVLDPSNWESDPDGPICDAKTYDRIVKWKDKRGSFSRITPGMIAYNMEENLLLAECCTRLAKGFHKVGIHLPRDRWYGPGAAASEWLKKQGIIKHDDLLNIMPKWFTTACRRSYYGGWFEIFSHGFIKGDSWNYDINSAYPYATHKLPHICPQCTYRHGAGNPPDNSEGMLLFKGTVFASNNRIGPVPYRAKNGSISRPSASQGWYWGFEVAAAKRAGLVSKIDYEEWVEFVPCKHPRPFKDVAAMYHMRLEVGKSNALGMALKLIINSIYGKLAQSVGSAPYNNWFYAAFITAHCRAQILDAIATHPNGIQSCLMVATDGVCFDSRHPNLAIGKQLGEWDETRYEDLCLFKPGVYWHKAGKEHLLAVKSRGVPKAQFAEQIGKAEGMFSRYTPRLYPGMRDPKAEPVLTLIDREWAWVNETIAWPEFEVSLPFRMKSCKQALNEGKWNSAGEVLEDFPVRQSSDPSTKRANPHWNTFKIRIDTTIHDANPLDIETTYHKETKGTISEDGDIGISPDWGDPFDPLIEAAMALRDGGKEKEWDPFQVS